MAEPRYGGAYTAPDEGEEEDIKITLEKKCHFSCTKYWEKYEACKGRIDAKGSGECTGWYVDYLHCVDGCTSKTLFKNLI